MKFSYNWIRQFVDGLDVPAESLERLITMKTAECEGVVTSGALLNGAVPARVLTAEPIEGSHNQKTTVDAGPYGIKTVVCGAKNCRAGDHDHIRSAGSEKRFGRAERWHARQRGGTRNQ